MAKRALRIAATADFHYGKHSRGTLHEAFAEISSNADIMLLCGDLTDYGLPEEAEALVADIRAAVNIPMLAVLAITTSNRDNQNWFARFLMMQGQRA